jgi:hypothetical protein
VGSLWLRLLGGGALREPHANLMYCIRCHDTKYPASRSSCPEPPGLHRVSSQMLGAPKMRRHATCRREPLKSGCGHHRRYLCCPTDQPIAA